MEGNDTKVNSAHHYPSRFTDLESVDRRASRIRSSNHPRSSTRQRIMGSNPIVLTAFRQAIQQREGEPTGADRKEPARWRIWFGCGESQGIRE